MEILLDIHHWQNVKSTYDGSIRTWTSKEKKNQ